MTPTADPIDLALRVASVFEELGLAYVVGGSIASSALGEIRSTQDVDFLVEAGPSDCRRLTESLGREFYVAESAVADALTRRSSFNVIDARTGLKADIFILPDRDLERQQLNRRRPELLGGPGERPVFLSSAEDIILHKMYWYRLGREVSDRQWRDVLGVMKTQAERLDLEYLRRWAERQGLEDLLERALREAGLG